MSAEIVVISVNPVERMLVIPEGKRKEAEEVCLEDKVEGWRGVELVFENEFSQGIQYGIRNTYHDAKAIVSFEELEAIRAYTAAVRSGVEQTMDEALDRLELLGADRAVELYHKFIN